jgi:hypothetical protein
MTHARTRLLALGALAAGVVSAGAALLASSATAVTTRSFVIDDKAGFAAGELERSAASSDGTLRAGVETRRLALADVPLVWSMARAEDGTAYLGTGNEGKVYRLRGEQLAELCGTQQLLVSALALGEGGTLYAGTLPEGRIYAIDTRAQAPTAREIARPDGVEHVWSLAWDGRRRVLFAATGPQGKVLAITPGTGTAAARVDVYWDAEAQHVLSLALAPDGALYAGTSDGAYVAKITAPGSAEILADLPGSEVNALAFAQGGLVAAANEFSESAGAISGGAPTPPASGSTSTRTPAPRARSGKGKLFRVSQDGRAELALALDDAHLTSVQVAPDGTIYAGAGKDGRVHRVAPDGTSLAWIDVEERQVMAIDLLGRDPLLVTGDAGAVYRVAAGTPATSTWTSKVLDASFRARFGELTWRATGPVTFETRSGNTERPDASWSAWSAALSSPGPVRSPAARYLQIRARLGSADTVVRAVTAYYLPQNQRALVRDVDMAPARPARSGDAAASDESAPAPSTTYKITWKVDNPDGDRLRYRLSYRGEAQTPWRELLRESEVLTRTEHAWETSGIPDGWYVLRVRASDELSNPAAYALSHAAESGPVLVDNHAPRIEGLAQDGARVRGRAVDDASTIARLEVAVDGREWTPLFPDDDLLDTRDERFTVDLAGLDPGEHVVAVRAYDAAGNPVSAEVVVRVGGAVRP